MAIYNAVIIICFVFGYFELDKKFSVSSKKAIATLLLLPPFFMTALRTINVGADTIPYFNTYNLIAKCSSLIEALQVSRMENGYVIANYVCSHMNLPFWGMQFIFALFIYISIIAFISKYSTNVGLSCLLFVTLCKFCGIMNTTRMWIAIAILLWATSFVIERKPIKYIALIVIAMQFHFTAIVFIVLYPCHYLFNTWKSRGVLLALATIFSVFSNELFIFITNVIGKYQGYLDSEYFVNGGNIAVYITLVMDLMFGFLYWFNYRSTNKTEIVKCNKYESLDCGRLFISIIVIIISIDIVGLTNTIMSRLVSYFHIYIIAFIPFAISKIDSMQIKLIVYILISIITTLYFEIVMIYRPGWFCVLPYEWIL